MLHTHAEGSWKENGGKSEGSRREVGGKMLVVFTENLIRREVGGSRREGGGKSEGSRREVGGKVFIKTEGSRREDLPMLHIHKAEGRH